MAFSDFKIHLWGFGSLQRVGGFAIVVLKGTLLESV